MMNSKKEIVKPAKRLIICECDAKFSNEADLKIHLDFFHQGEKEVKVRIQKVYINNEPKVKVETVSGSRHGSGSSGISPKPSGSTPKQQKNTCAQRKKVTIQKFDVVKLEKNASQDEGDSNAAAYASLQSSMIKLEDLREKVVMNLLPGQTVPKTTKPITIPRNALIHHPMTVKSDDNMYGKTSIVQVEPENARGKVVISGSPSKPIMLRRVKPIVIPKNKIMSLPANNVVEKDTQPMFVVLKSGDNKFIVQNNCSNFQVEQNAQNTTRLNTQRNNITSEGSPATIIIRNNTSYGLPVVNNARNTNIKKKYTILSKNDKEIENVDLQKKHVTKNVSPVKEIVSCNSLRTVRKATSLQEPQPSKSLNDALKNPKMVSKYVIRHKQPEDQELSSTQTSANENQVHYEQHSHQYIVPESDPVEYEEIEQIVVYDTDIQDTAHQDCSEEANQVYEENVDEEKNDGNDNGEQLMPGQVCQMTGPNTILVECSGDVKKEFYFCDLCGRTSDNERQLRYHKTRYHKIKTVQPPSKDDVECDLCGNSYGSEKSLKMHLTKTHKINSHQREKKFVCNDCGKSFTYNFQLTFHNRIHTGERPYACEICPKAFTTKAFLQIHRRGHTGEKPFKCHVCGKAFNVTNNLQLHIRTHTGEKPFICPHCGKAFIGQGALWRHKKVHTGEKPYSCPECGKSFSQSNSMKLHVMTVHLKVPTPYKSRKRMKGPELESYQNRAKQRKYSKLLIESKPISIENTQAEAKKTRHGLHAKKRPMQVELIHATTSKEIPKLETYDKVECSPEEVEYEEVYEDFIKQEDMY